MTVADPHHRAESLRRDCNMAERGWCPFARKLPITTGEQSNDDPNIPKSAICSHISAGWDSRSWLQNEKNDASVHFLIRIENGVAVVYQFISIFKTAYGNGRHSGVNNPYMPAWIKDMIRKKQGINFATISIEHEGVYPQSLPFSEIMIQASIKLQQWICSEIKTIQKNREHIIGHYQVDHVDRAFCPGGPAGSLFPFERIVRELNMAGSFTPPGAAHAITVPQFIQFYQAEPNALKYFGLPFEDTKQEILSDGHPYTVQWFERARFELHGNTVMLGLVGYEARSK